MVMTPGNRVLVIDPLDTADAGPWSTQHWDHIVDIGLGGASTYKRWTTNFQCPVATLGSLRNGFDDFRRVRDLLGVGCGDLIDKLGLDWWEIMSLLLHGEMEALVLLQRFVCTLGTSAQLFVTRPGLHASLLQCLTSMPLKIFPRRHGAERGGPGHYFRVFRKLSALQMIDVFWDKYDAGYQVRGLAASKGPARETPVTLLPTAYVNVSRTGLAYANTFTEEKFLLVATRRSGWVKDLPQNVAATWLSSYASLDDRRQENALIANAWHSLLAKLKTVPEFEILDRLGYLEAFPLRFRRGLEVRDAWRNVLETEPIHAVLCADDSNPYTRLPLLLARQLGLPNIACHHGALDGRYIFKRSYGDSIWAKGKMEQDYLVRKCGVPAEIVEVAAPALPDKWTTAPHTSRSQNQPFIIFFSEASDVSGGRPAEFYRDVVPPLAELALKTGRKLIVKLHPAESERERQRTLERILSDDQRSATEIVTGALTEELLAKAWFGITILSTVTTECAVRGIPCFLCKWLEFWPYDYVEQFIRFGVGVGLDHPDEIEKIPQYLERLEPADVRGNSWNPAHPSRLSQYIASSLHQVPFLEAEKAMPATRVSR